MIGDLPRRIDRTWGYAWRKVPGRGWVREHHLVWELAGNGKVPTGKVLHHLDENKLNNELSNLQLMSRREHAANHSSGREVSEETRKAMRIGSKNRCASEEHRRSLSERAKAQHAAGKLGRATWPEGTKPDPEKMRKHGLQHADRLREMSQKNSSEEMSRRSKQRQIFKKEKTA